MKRDKVLPPTRVTPQERKAAYMVAKKYSKIYRNKTEKELGFSEFLRAVISHADKNDINLWPYLGIEED